LTFRFANVEGRSALVDSDGRWFDASKVSGGVISADPMGAWLQLDELHRAAGLIAQAMPDGNVSDADLRPPIPLPRSVFAVGLNYQSHADEAKMKLPNAPLIFTKFPSCLAGPTDPVILGGSTDDYEAELVVVIGRGGRAIRREDAWGHVGGLTAGQDISDRALQFAAEPAHFDLGKSRDTYGPIGPVVVSTDSFADPGDLLITCDINGERRQEDRTSNLIFDIPTLISYLSRILSLSPGDLIFTGTPEGVGAASLRFLGDGDVITTTIEGIGTLTNRCRAPAG
jgi:2,4-didehydro-3-deoxy-L-rhamnonate hydrolase